MTAACTFSNFTLGTDIKKARKHRHLPITFQADVTDFDGESHSFELEAWSNEEAERLAQQRCRSLGIDASYICVYQF